MSRRVAVGFWGGALLGLAVMIAYNASAETSALEGGHRRLRFAAALFVAIVFGGSARRSLRSSSKAANAAGGSTEPVAPPNGAISVPDRLRALEQLGIAR